MALDVLEEDIIDKVGLSCVRAHGADTCAAGFVASDVLDVDVAAVTLYRDTILSSMVSIWPV